MVLSIENIVMIAIQLLISGLIAILWQDRKTMVADLRNLEKEINNIRFNYLNRFDDLKEHVSSMQLKVIERISILEARLEKTLKLGDIT